jgi:ferrous iron transport protein A
MKLPFVREGYSAKIKAINGGITIKRRLEEIGIIPGRQITILKSGPGPVLVRLENNKIGLGFGEAMKIEVE